MPESPNISFKIPIRLSAVLVKFCAASIIFSSLVLSTIASSFTLLPEKPKNIAAIYVNNMSNTEWDNPDAENWILAKEAWYVLGSGRSEGMGAPEAVPFSSKESATKFVNEQGGKVYDFSSIPKRYILETQE